MPLPHVVLRLSACSFAARSACRGDQVATLARFLEKRVGTLEWWVGGVASAADPPPRNFGLATAPARCGATPAFIDWSVEVKQFLTGVFIATRPGAAPSAVRKSVSPEDGPWTDIADAVAEIRAVDTTYLEVALGDPSPAPGLIEQFHAISISR